MNKRCAFAVTCLVCATYTGAYAATLGRLFFTPEQRGQIDARPFQDNESRNPTLTVNGIVQKHGGVRTVWINGVAQSSVSAQENSASVTLSLPNKNHPVTLKVGEKIQLAPSAK